MRKIIVAAAAVAVLFVAGCARTAAAPPAAPQDQEPVLAAALGFVENAKLGPIVVDGEGRTLYRFDEDGTDPPKSNCNGGCATAWPPVPAVDPAAVSSLDPALIGQVTRDDGTRQLTLAGSPIYRYVKDTGRGEANGHTLNGTWFAVTPAGKKAGGAPSSPSATGGPALSVVEHPTLGTIVVDAQGRTLYRSDKDTTNPTRSKCNGDCADAWPPVPAVDPSDVTGIDADLIGTVTRKDGTKQATLGRRPLYRFANDRQPGDANGHGAAGDFFAITPKGHRANNGKIA